MNDRHRALRRAGTLLTDLVISLVVLALTVWGLDWAARISAEGVVARSVQHAQQLTQQPNVDVHGWFFLPQVVTGRYNKVDITLRNLREGTLRLSSVTAHLQGTHVPLHAVVTNGVSTILVEQSRETLVFTYAALNTYLQTQDSPFTLAAGPAGQVKVTGHAKILGKSFAVSADATVRPAPGYLQITPTQLDTGSSLDAASRVLLGQRLTLAIPTAMFPFGQQVTSISPGKTTLTVRASGTNVLISLPPKSEQ